MIAIDLVFAKNAIIETAQKWLDEQRDTDGEVNPGVISTGLVVTGHIRQGFPLTESKVASKAQIKGLGGPAVARILARHGENRKFLSEGGRTSRGSRPRGVELASLYTETLTDLQMVDLDENQLEALAEAGQEWFVERLRVEYYSKQRVKAEIFPDQPISMAIEALLAAGDEKGGNTAGAVAQHLVGAKLSMRFPNEAIGLDSYTTADLQTSREGDFTVGDTAFHVTMRPTQNLMDNRCRANISNGYRPVVLVPEKLTEAANQLADLASLSNKVSVIGIERFIGLNVEEMGVFRSSEIRSGLRTLLEMYNERIKISESDLSLQIEIPSNL